MDPKIAKKTQDTLGKIIKKPPLTDKLLGKPPFRFLHDIMTSVIKTTGFMKGLFTDSELNSENVKDKDSKIAFLQKSIDFICLVTGKSLSAKPSKIVAGHEPEKTNDFLVALANAINAKVDNDEYIKKFFNKGKDSKDDTKKDRSKDRTDEKRKRDREEKRDRGKSADRDRDDRGEKEDRKEREEKKDRERSRDREKEDRHRDRDREKRRKHRDEDAGKENETPAEMVNGDADQSEPEPPPRLARPTSAKGSRRRREEDEGQTRSMRASEPAVGEGDLPPQVAAARSSARPSSARPAPPKRKQEIVENEPAMRLGSGKPTNVIVDDGKGDDEDDDDETFVVEESAPPPPEPEQNIAKPSEDGEDEDHGGLVKKMLETKKELEGGSQQKSQSTKKTEIERPTLTDAQRRKQREQIQKEIDKLRGSIQTLTRSANPLGKIMDYVQEDLDSMQKELEKWKVENKEHALSLKREKSITDKAIEPLKAQLSEVDQAISDQLDLIAAVKSNIIRNDVKIEKMLTSIAKS